MEVRYMLMNTLSIIVRHSRIFSERKMQSFDIGFPEQIVLMYLSKYNDVNQDAIAQHFMIDKGAIARTLSKLEEKDFIKRYQNSDNKRENLLSLSEKGVNVIAYMSDVLNEWNEQIFNGLSEDDIKQLIRTTDIMAANVVKATNKNRSYNDDRTE